MIKRLFDILVSGLLVTILAPVFILIAIAIRIYDGGASLFGQARVGKCGGIFKMWKFRSMVIDAEVIGGYSTEDNDPRVTPVGRFIRRFSLDELPQLINVFIGDMSIVGPRPDVPAQRKLYTEGEWEVRHSVRPGITGLSQSTLRSAATAEQRKALDLEYVKNASMMFDLKIIVMTIKQVLSKGGN